MLLAATFISLLSSAEPVLAAPPTEDVVLEAPPDTGPSVWDALVDHRVVLTLEDGQTVRGTVLSVTDDALVCASSIDGRMIVVDVQQIRFVHVQALPGNKRLKKPENGQGLIVMGSIATAAGGALGVATLVMGAVCYDGWSGMCAWITMPFAAVGMANLSMGIPFLSSGLRKRKNLRAAKAAAVPAVSAFLVPGPTGVTAGVGLRF